MNLEHSQSPPIQGIGNNSLSDLSILKANKTVIHGRRPVPYLPRSTKNSPDGRRRICATNPTCSRSACSNHHQGQCTHTISQRELSCSSLRTLSVGLPAHPLPYEERRPASRHRTTLGATQGNCDATQPDSEKRIVKSMSAPGRNVVLPQSDTCHNRQALPASQDHKSRYSATRPGASTQPPQSDTPEKHHLFQAPARKALRVRPEPMVEKTGLEPVTSRKPSGRTTKLCYIPKRPTIINHSTVLDHGQSAPGGGFEPQ